jgi:hypothetical protein
MALRDTHQLDRSAPLRIGRWQDIMRSREGNEPLPFAIMHAMLRSRVVKLSDIGTGHVAYSWIQTTKNDGHYYDGNRIMQLIAHRTGSFGGVHQTLGPINTDELSGAIQSALRARIDEMKFFEISDAPASRIPDDFHTSITITDGPRTHSAGYDGLSKGSVAAALGGLVELLLDGGFEFHDEPGWGSVTATASSDSGRWEAWYNRMPGFDDPDLHVAGTVELASGGHTARLELRPDGIVDEPGVVTFQLVIDTSGVGDTRITERQVSWSGYVGPDIEEVRIRTDDGVVSSSVTIAQ